MQIEIPDDEAAALRERQLEWGYTLDESRRYHDKAVADCRLHHAADWSYIIALLEWSPPREFKVGDEVHWTRGECGLLFTVRGVHDGILWDGDGMYEVENVVLVKAVDDAD